MSPAVCFGALWGVSGLFLHIAKVAFVINIVAFVDFSAVYVGFIF